MGVSVGGMKSGRGWLADVVLVNESHDVRAPGDVLLFRSAGEACRYLEGWWVEDEEGFVFTAAGERLDLGVDNSGDVVVERREPCADGETIVLGWLRASAAARLATRRSRAARGRAVLSAAEERGDLPGTVEGLIAYIGFTG